MSEELNASEADVTNAIAAEQWRVSELRKAGDIMRADLGQAALNSGEFTRSIRSQLNVAEPVVLPPAAPGHVSSARPEDYHAPERPYGEGLKVDTVMQLGELAAANGWDQMFGGIVTQHLADIGREFKGMNAETREAWTTSQKALAVQMAGSDEQAAKWLAATKAALGKTALGREISETGAVHSVFLQRTIWNLAQAAKGFKE
ncbi:hypothetical protein [Hyphomicrobium sulfonivorans]|uniref:hypothetical protein n=1 Tax=Hyphomicrobium sulfonivorans TaxID=121290 RepID=UPI00156E1BEC|nr:hypothetical protein [Hyphomicrobium sulfonivorans]MBI1651164.1 hypothetical protein [Hyphomicrobium sulfonivorans]NSL72452.1 hypothetical protein [Hyphomicrobium sulfonivorans]